MYRMVLRGRIKRRNRSRMERRRSIGVIRCFEMSSLIELENDVRE